MRIDDKQNYEDRGIEMIYINAIVLVLTVVLAIISRKHFSKYKDGVGARSCLKALVLSMGYGVWIFLRDILPLESMGNSLRQQLGKRQVATPKRLEQITESFIASCIGTFLVIIFSFNLVDAGINISAHLKHEDTNKIQREDYAGKDSEEKIYYQVSGKQQSVVLNVSPVRLSQEEFYHEADVVADEIRRELLPEEVLISKDIELPLVDKKDAFVISWESDRPELLSSKGRVNLEAIQDNTAVNLTMTVFYYDYSMAYSYKVLVGREGKTEDRIIAEYLSQVLSDLEQETIGEQAFYIPDKIDDIELKVEKDKKKNGRILGLGIIFAIVVVGIFLSRLKDSGRARDEKLMRQYPFFVDNLWLYLEAGMNMRKALQECVNSWDREDTYLREQLLFTLNQIENGEVEYIAYEELGARLNLAPYNNLMRHISQNVRMGTKDLRNLMETEATMAIEGKKERAKRLGEEASTKLIFPMILLLAVVMVIIMTPAFMGF
ncbi:MAG: type II secretion system F family protein [Lachnospiraceae bacterium]|nr:type II secretion system F family protein [Lachnospiraceae bacterium]